MAIINFVTASGTSHNATGGSNPTYGYDENFTTAHSSSAEPATIISEHTFATPVIVTQFVWRLYAGSGASGKYAISGTSTVYVEYKVNDVWSYVPTSYISNSFSDDGDDSDTSGSCSAGSQTITYTYDCNISYVQAVRAYAYTTAAAAGGEGQSSRNSYIYEVQSWGNQYVDIGFRIPDGNGVIRTIAAEPLLSTHKVRIYRVSMIYGIPLVDTTAAGALPFRIYNGSATKAFLEYS